MLGPECTRTTKYTVLLLKANSYDWAVLPELVFRQHSLTYIALQNAIQFPTGPLLETASGEGHKQWPSLELPALLNQWGRQAVSRVRRTKSISGQRGGRNRVQGGSGRWWIQWQWCILDLNPSILNLIAPFLILDICHQN